VLEMSTDSLQRALHKQPKNVLEVNGHLVTPAQRDMLTRIGKNRGVVGVMSGEDQRNMVVTARMGGRMQTIQVDPEGGITFLTNLPIVRRPNRRLL
jgi:hypothetical protein